MEDATKVHVRNKDGSLRYNRLLDSGGSRLPFASGYGSVNRQEMAKQGCEILPGWPESDAPQDPPPQR